MGTIPAQGGHRRAAAHYSLESEDNYSQQNGGGDFSFQNGSAHMSQSLGEYRLQNGSTLRLNGDVQLQHASTPESHTRLRGAADLVRQNGGADPMRSNGGIDSMRQNGGSDALRLNGEPGGSLEQQQRRINSDYGEQQQRRINGDYGKQNGGDAGEGGGRSEQYARNWPPVSQSPADKPQANKVNISQFLKISFS